MSWQKEVDELRRREAMARLDKVRSPLRKPGPRSFGYRP
jgi:hypothetical protein